MKDHLLFSSSGRISFSFTMLKLIWLSSCPNKLFTFCHKLLFHLKGTETVAELEVEVCKLFEVSTLENVISSRHCGRASVGDPFLKEWRSDSMREYLLERVLSRRFWWRKGMARDGGANPKQINVQNLESLLVSHSSPIPVPQRRRRWDLWDTKNQVNQENFKLRFQK